MKMTKFPIKRRVPTFCTPALDPLLLISVNLNFCAKHSKKMLQCLVKQLRACMAHLNIILLKSITQITILQTLCCTNLGPRPWAEHCCPRLCSKIFQNFGFTLKFYMKSNFSTLEVCFPKLTYP